MHPINEDEVRINYYITPHNKTWGSGFVTLIYGDCIMTDAGNLYYCVKGGITAEYPPVPPDYSFEWHTGFHELISGTAVIAYIGKDTYEGYWKPAYFRGVSWYFSTLGLIWFVKSRCPMVYTFKTEILEHIKKAVDFAVCVWYANKSYYKGMLVVGDNGYIWQCRNNGASGASISWPGTPVVGTTEHIDAGVTWKCFGKSTNHTPPVVWQIVDTNVNMDEFVYPDSHDAYASTLACLLDEMRLAELLPVGFESELSKQGPSGGIYTYVEGVKAIVYNNIMMHLDPVNGMSHAFQYKIFPDGTGNIFDIQFLMDVVEAYAGIVASINFYSDPTYSDPSWATYLNAFLAKYLSSIRDMWVSDYGTYGAFKYHVGYNLDDTPENPLYYPWVMAQAWPKLWDIPLDYYMIRGAFLYMQEQYPGWWKVNGIDDLAAIGPHVGFYKYDQSDRVRREIMERVEWEKGFLLGPELFLQDFGYYLWLKSRPFD
jgi:hypothetical protein